MFRLFAGTLLLALLSVGHRVSCQESVFGASEKSKPRKGFIITGAGSIDMPGGDMAKRFGTSYRIGFGLLHKSEHNWLIGAKFEFITGSDIKEDSLMINIRDKYSTPNGKYVELVTQSGTRMGIPIFERGYATGFEFGKIINVIAKRPDDGIMALTTIGFMQHKITIYDQDNVISELRGNYIKGYDRLTNGMFVEQYVGYVHFSKSKLINFHLGIDALFGFTQGRRDYLFDVMRSDNKNRLDILFGLRGGWYIPMFKRKSEDMVFD